LKKPVLSDVKFWFVMKKTGPAASEKRF